MSARPGPGGGYRATGIPTAISLTGINDCMGGFDDTQRENFSPLCGGPNSRLRISDSVDLVELSHQQLQWG